MTGRELGEILSEEFSKDRWGMVHTDSFYHPQPAGSRSDDAGLLEVLNRAAKVITEKLTTTNTGQRS